MPWTLALPLLFSLFWISRLLLESRGVAIEAAVICGLAFREVLLLSYQHQVLPNVAVFSFLGLGLCLSLSVWYISGVNIANIQKFCKRSGKDESVIITEVRDSAPMPFIILCRTTHTRLFPKKNSFSYSYLNLAVPVGFTGSIGSLVSVDLGVDTFSAKSLPAKKSSWLSIRAADYLYRGNGHLGLLGKLQVYLLSQGEDPGKYSSAWLFTAPRFLGYAFNPVSFWYLYEGSRLSAMILEVNNTFDERRLYFMKNDASIDEAEISKFTKSWPKDFHVSPFNSRKGSYSLVARDPMSSTNPRVDNTITLSSSKGHPKLVARIFSTTGGVDTATMTVYSRARFIALWWWVGFMTYPRIVKEAWRLFFKRKLHVWFRPEVQRTSIGRNETKRERIIEACFRRYLRALAEQSSHQSSLNYIASGSNCVQTETFKSKVTKTSEEGKSSFQVLTPAFYAQFATSSSPAEFIVQSAARPSNMETFHTPDPLGISALIKELELKKLPTALPIVWWLLRFLRPSGQIHPLDNFVRTELPPALAEAYRLAVTTLLVSQWVAFGVPELLDAVIGLVRLVLCYSSMQIIIQNLREWPEAGAWDLTFFMSALHLWLVGEEWIRQPSNA